MTKKKVSTQEKISKLREFFKKLKRKNKFRKFLIPRFQIYRCFKGVIPLFDFRLSINVSSNNLFLHLDQISQNKTIKKASSGKYKIKITKKRLKHTVFIVLQKFLKTIQQTIKQKNLILILTSPKFLRKKFLKLFRILFKGCNIFIKIQPLKCFNGCRPKKKRRKKRARLKIFKVV